MNKYTLEDLREQLEYAKDKIHQHTYDVIDYVIFDVCYSIISVFDTTNTITKCLHNQIYIFETSTDRDIQEFEKGLSRSCGTNTVIDLDILKKDLKILEELDIK